MPKPWWMIESEKKKFLPEYPKCSDGCKYYGKKFHKYIKYKGKIPCEQYECLRYPGSYCCKFTVICSEFEKDTMI